VEATRLISPEVLQPAPYMATQVTLVIKEVGEGERLDGRGAPG
jgi:hypothetical protein